MKFIQIQYFNFWRKWKRKKLNRADWVLVFSFPPVSRQFQIQDALKGLRSFGWSRNLSSRDEPKEWLHIIKSERTRRGGKGGFSARAGGGGGDASCEET